MNAEHRAMGDPPTTDSRDELALDILVPYWGDPDYMKQTVQSVLTQTSDSWYLTIVDDAYPSSEIADYVTALNHRRIRYLRKDMNSGITENFRTCVELAERQLMVLLGCDDRLLPDYVEKVLAAHRAYPAAAIIQPGVRVIDEDGSEVRPLVDRVKSAMIRPLGVGFRLQHGEQLAARLLRGNWLYWPSLTFRTDRIKAVPFRDGYTVTQDIVLIMDMVFAGDQVLTFSDVCFEYRRHGASASSVKLVDGSRFGEERSFSRLSAGTAEKLGWRRARRAALARLTSRAHAITLIPRAAIRADRGAVAELVRHGFGNWRG